MPSFNFSINKGKVNREKTSAKYIIIENKCEGLICELENNIYKVKYKEELYSITVESFKTKHKKIIYARWKDKYGHRIKIIRDIDNRIETNTKLYCAIAPGLIAKGKLVKTPFGSIKFHIRNCYNIGDITEISFSIQDWKLYEEEIKNKELDLLTEL